MVIRKRWAKCTRVVALAENGVENNMTNFEKITNSPEDLADFLEHTCGYTNCPPDPWPCQQVDYDDSSKTCVECWRLWLVAEAEGEN